MMKSLFEGILERLNNGDSQEDIANDMANALNKATEAWNRDKLRKEEEARITSRKNAYGEKIASLVNAYYDKFWSDVNRKPDELTGEKVAAFLDSSAKLANSLNKLVDKYKEVIPEESEEDGIEDPDTEPEPKVEVVPTGEFLPSAIANTLETEDSGECEVHFKSVKQVNNEAPEVEEYNGKISLDEALARLSDFTKNW